MVRLRAQFSGDLMCCGLRIGMFGESVPAEWVK